MSDLAEKVKRIKQRHAKQEAHQANWADDPSLVYYMGAAHKDLAELLDALERLERERDEARGAATVLLGCLTGISEDFEDEKTTSEIAKRVNAALEQHGQIASDFIAAYEAARARITSLEAQLAAVTTERTPGTVEVCPTCKREWATMHPDDKARCPGVNPFGDSPCPVRAAQHPTPSQGMTP